MSDDKLIARPGLLSAKERFDSLKGRRKIPYSFEQLFHLFKADTVPFSEIARQAGVKQQAIQQLYYRYFKDLFRGRSGIDRIISATPQRRAAKVEQAKQLFREVPLLKLVARQARAAGCSVEAVPADAPGAIYLERLRINGEICSIHLLTKKQKPSPQNVGWLIRMRISMSTLAEVNFVIIRTAIKGFPVHTFVVPVRTILAVHKGLAGRSAVNFWLPTKQLPTRKTHFNWWAHENAWHHLMPRRESRAHAVRP